MRTECYFKNKIRYSWFMSWGKSSSCIRKNGECDNGVGVTFDRGWNWLKWKLWFVNCHSVPTHCCRPLFFLTNVYRCCLESRDAFERLLRTNRVVVDVFVMELIRLPKVRCQIARLDKPYPHCDNVKVSYGKIIRVTFCNCQNTPVKWKRAVKNLEIRWWKFWFHIWNE